MATSKPQITTDEIWAKTAAAADKAKPAQLKVDDGWAFGEMPPFQIFNWFKNIYSQMFVHIQEYGIPEWSADIEYQKGGLAMHSEEVWKAQSINKNKQPGVAPEWTKPFDIQLPIGSVIAYRGIIADIPSGWQLVTDLNDRFLMGTSIIGDVGKTGGSSTSSLPMHSHTASTNTAAAHVHAAAHNHTGSAAVIAAHKHTANHNHSASSTSAAAHTHTATHNHTGSAAVIAAHVHTATHNHTATATTVGNHDHTATHNHTGSVGSAGTHSHTANHSHNASAASNGTHTHSYTDSTFKPQSGSHFGGSVQWNNSDVAKTTGSAGAHSHTVTVDTVSFSTSSTGSHLHGVTINTKTFNTGNAGSHNHSITVNTISFNTGSGGSHTHAITINTKTFNTGSAGSHNHSITIDTISFSTGTGGSHTHAITINTETFNTQNGGAHSHTIAVSNSGTTAAGGNLPPYKKIMYIERIS